MVSNVTAANSGVPFLPTVWEVASGIYEWRRPEDSKPDFALPAGWEIQHRMEPDNNSGQTLLQISTRDSFANLRTVGYIANIKKAKDTYWTTTPFQFTVICNLTFRTSPLFLFLSKGLTLYGVISGHFKVPPS